MAGHSKWNNIQVRKGKQDSKRAALFTKMARDIASAAKEGGADPAMNPRLKTMVEKARVASMPKDNIERAINRGAGVGEAAHLSPVVYEGKGPGGIDIIVEVRTDNKNRTASDIKSLFTKNGGSIGAPGSAMWNFEQKGYIEARTLSSKAGEMQMLEIMDLGVQDLEEAEGGFDVYTSPADLMRVRSALEKLGYEVETAKLMLDPKSTSTLEGEVLDQALTLLGLLDEYADTEGVYTNLA